MPKPDPTPYVDLKPYAHLSDYETAVALGSRRPSADALVIAKERAGVHDYPRKAGRARCAGGRDGIPVRCSRTALVGQQWCGMHLSKVSKLAPVAERPASATKILTPAASDNADVLPSRPASTVADLPEVVMAVESLLRVSQAAEARLARIEAHVQLMAEARRAPEPLMTADEAAAYLNVSTANVYRLAKDHRIPHVRMYGSLRFRVRSIDEWTQSKEVPAVR